MTRGARQHRAAFPPTWAHAIAALRNEWVLLSLIVALAMIVRLYRFGAIPGGLNQDEGSLAYDAYSLLRYGMERNGHTWPLMLEAYGSSMSGTLAAYLSMPFMAIGGLTIATARSLNAVMGIITVGTFWAIGREGWNARTGLLAAFFVAISPWHIMASRWGLDCNLFPPLFALAFLVLLTLRERPWGLSLSAAIFGLSLYSYGVALVAVPAFLLLALAALHLRGEWRWKPILAAGACFAVIALPMAVYLFVNERELPTVHLGPFTITNLATTPRYREGSSVFSAHFFMDAVHNLRTFGYALLRQHDGWSHNTMWPHGIVYFPGAVAAVLGAGALLRRAVRERHSGSLYMLAWMGAAVVLGGVVHADAINRINIAMLPMIFCCALGVSVVPWPRVRVAVVCMFLVLFGWFSWDYFTVFPQKIAPEFFAGLTDASAKASSLTTGKICVTEQANMPEIAVLFGTKLDPHIFASTVEYADPNAHYRHAIRFGRYTFGLARCDAEGGGAAYVAHAAEVPALISRGFALQGTYQGYSVLTPPTASAL